MISNFRHQLETYVLNEFLPFNSNTQTPLVEMRTCAGGVPVSAIELNYMGFTECLTNVDNN